QEGDGDEGWGQFRMRHSVSSISLVRHVRCASCGGHARSGQLLGAGPKQSILLNVAALRASVRQMESTSHDPFATLAAFGCGRTGYTRHNLAGNALHSRAGAIARWLLSDLTFGQLSRRPARG